ncbi:MAG: hypothetical protein LBK71_03220, partial [Verrucomicrobiales bacterium]|nr:hypothetical protein [Verrucomicrobiales bacterium]
MNPKLTLLTLSVCFAAKRLGIRASVYLLAYFTALNAFATSLYVNGTTYPAEADKTYVMPNAWTSALRVSFPGAVYSGTNINLSGTETQSNGVLHVSHSDATAAITGGTITLIGAPVTTYRQYAVWLQHAGSNLSLQDVTINVNIGGADATITTGISIGSGARLTADNLRVDIKTENTIGAALYMDTGTGNTAHLTNSTLVSNKDYLVYMGHNATITGSNVTLHTTGGTEFMVQLVTSSTLILTDSAITADGDGQSIFNLRPNSYYTDIDPAQGIHVELINTNVTAAGDLMHTGGLGIDDVTHLTGAKEFLITGGTINIGAKLINAARDQNFIVTITDATVTNGADLLTVSDSATLQLSLNNTA